MARKKPGPKPKPLSELGKTALWYRTKATPEQIKKHRDTSHKAGSTEKAIKKRSEDNKNRKALGLKVGDQRDAARKKGGGFIAQSNKKNRAANGHGNRSRFSA
tara:strand:- start:1198 stop:1506 length:309 start_codon:yes stop_codon:yes gene_type:complete